jgi:sarcosine oxidase / L-pipecolate oxidase
LIDYHPRFLGLFIATGDSGHAFKVFPVIGEKIVDAIEGQLERDLQNLWRWREEIPVTFNGADDGTRGGNRDMILDHEQRKEMTTSL